MFDTDLAALAVPATCPVAVTAASSASPPVPVDCTYTVTLGSDAGFWDTARLTIFMTEGGVFDSAEPVASADPAGYGDLTLEFADCTEGLVEYEITSLGISGKIPIQRITLDNVPTCEALSSPQP